MTSQPEAGTPKPHSKIDPLPYFPQLCRVLGGVTISIVLVYLEIHQSALEPDPDAIRSLAGLRNPPAMLDCDQACQDLGVSRRTLHTALESLGSWWKAEAQRSAASRSGRVFLRYDNTRAHPVRPYAFVGSRSFLKPRTIAVHRNQPRLAQIFIDAGITELREPTRSLYGRYAEFSETCVSSRSLGSLSDLLGESLKVTPAKRGLAAGWSDERRMRQAAKMTEYQAEQRKKRQNGLVGGPTARR